MYLTILGMNGPYPAAGSATSGYFVRSEKTRVVLDLGSGTLSRLTGLTPPETLDALFLSHWHYDHCCDVLPLIFYLAALAEKPLPVYAPRDEKSLVRQAVLDCPGMALREVAPGDEITVGDMTIQVGRARHPVPAVMYRVKSGERTLVYTGDTNTVEGLMSFAQNADLLLADGLFPQEKWQETLPHLSACHAAELARDAHVGRLLITHLNPQIDPVSLLAQARALYPAAALAECGATYAV